MNDRDVNLNFESSIKDLSLPNSMFINGIVVKLENLHKCQTEKGMMI